MTIARSVIESAAKEHGIAAKEITGPRRWSHLVRARREVACVLREMGWSYPSIGRALGNRHHATIMNLCDCFDRRRA